MSHKMFRKELIGMRVYTVGGTDLGELDDIVIDNDTGLVKYLLIRFYGKTTQHHKTDGKGRLIYSVNEMMVSDGHLIVS